MAEITIRIDTEADTKEVEETRRQLKELGLVGDKSSDSIASGFIKADSGDVRLDITDMDVEQANKLANQYNIWATPTYVMLDSNGQIISRKEGAMPKDDFNQWVQITAQQANNQASAN